jgi:hypothetical protein
MKLQQALKIGLKCGLDTPVECVNNILLHWGSILLYTESRKELKELVEDAKSQGIKFSEVCGCATHGSIEQRCVNCKKAAAVLEDE